MKSLLMFALLLLFVPARIALAQCNVPGCEAATAVVAGARATARAIITEEAPAPTATTLPTATTAPSSTPAPTATPLPTPTSTPTATPVSTPTAAPTATMTNTPQVTPALPPTENASPFLVLAGFALIVLAVALAVLFIFGARKNGR